MQKTCLFCDAPVTRAAGVCSKEEHWARVYQGQYSWKDTKRLLNGKPDLSKGRGAVRDIIKPGESYDFTKTHVYPSPRQLPDSDIFAHRDDPMPILAARAKRYGLTLDALKDLLAKQNNECAICGEDLDLFTAVIDHCHDCGSNYIRKPNGNPHSVRGILHSRCNIGYPLRFFEQPAMIQRALSYALDHHKICVAKEVPA